MDELMTREQAARLLAKPASWLRYAEQHKLIPFVKVGRQIRYRLSDLERWIESRVIPAGRADEELGSTIDGGRRQERDRGVSSPTTRLAVASKRRSK